MARTWATTSRHLLVALSACLLLACQGEAQPATDGRTALSNDDRQEELTSVVQAVIDAPALRPYYHPEEEGRVPLVLVIPVDLNAELRKFDSPVRVVEQPAADQPFLEITDIRRTADGYSVDIRYPVEGIRASFDLARDDAGRWVIRSHELTET